MNQNNLANHYFISYSRKDKAIARQIKEDLEQSGFHIWMDESDIVKGTEWEEAIRKSIQLSIEVLYLASPNSRSSPHVNGELQLAKDNKKSIIPIWVEGSAKWSDVARIGYIGVQYFDMRGEAYQSEIYALIQTLKNPSDHEERFSRYFEEDDDSGLPEVERMINPSPTNQEPATERHDMPEDIDQPKSNPYKGLHAFEYHDAKFFFGRKNLVDKMMQHVKDLLSEEKRYSQVPRFMMVVGASGSGKSSVVMAGLLPALEDKENIPEVKRWLFLEPVRPGEDPISALALTLKLPFLNERRGDLSPLRRWKQVDLRKTLDDPDCRGLTELLRKITSSPDQRVVLLIDQFEEIFAPTVKSDQREQFINLLMTTATEPGTPILLLFTLRADFYDRILDQAALYKKVERHLINIPPMTREELREVIEEPVRHSDVNVTFDPYLAEDLLHEVRRRPESLPLLQFTLEQLFEHRDGRRLTRQSYEEKIGGLQGAIDKHAEVVYNRQLRTSEHQVEAKKLFTEYFINIAESHGETSHLESGEGITRRRVTQAELQRNDPQSSIRRETIEAFVNARLLTATSTVRQSTQSLEDITDITYEISHEVLLNAWGRLREWIQEDRAEIYWKQSERYRLQSQLYWVQSLHQQMEQWDQEENPKRKAELLVEKLALQQLQDYKQREKLDSLAEKFLQASLARQKRQKIRRYLSSGATALLILLLALGIIFRNVIFPPPADPTIVTSLADSGPGTLPYALQKASDGATITFATSLKGQTISLTHTGLDINKSITLHGPGPAPADHILISSRNTGNFIHIEASKNVVIENITFANSYTQKNSIIENHGNLTINNSSISDNKSYGYGGVISNKGGNLTLNNDTLEKNILSTNGGAIYNLFGTVSINNSTISGNEAYGNGGGVFSQGGIVAVRGGTISNNTADDNAGGGIDILNGDLSMSGTHIESNHSDHTNGKSSDGIGGGIAIQGSVAFITTSVITANTASWKGGGIVVAEDTDNAASSLLKLQDIIRTDNPNVYYIGRNSAGSNQDKDIAGELVTPTSTNLQLFADTSIDNLGNPPASYPPQRLPNYLGVANINAFCLNKGDSYGHISTTVDKTATDIMFTCFNQSNQPVTPDFSGQAICQSQYSTSPGVNSVIDRMAEYSDPTSLQCYKNLKLLAPIGQGGFAKYCASQPQYTGLFNDPQDRQTAYDWLCQPEDNSKLPVGLSVTDACNLQYGIKNAVDRLANYDSVDGWECWVPA